MGELDDIKHTEEKREADRDERIHHAEHETVHDILGKEPHIHISDPVRAEKAKRDRTLAQPVPLVCYFCPGNLRLPVAYSLSSHSTNLPSWTTYLVIKATVFWPWSSNVTFPMMESRS